MDMTERKEPGTEWVRMAKAARRLGVPRTTLINRVAKGEFRTMTVDDTLFVAIPVAAGAAAADQMAA